jgi:hypothetical protein
MFQRYRRYHQMHGPDSEIITVGMRHIAGGERDVDWLVNSWISPLIPRQFYSRLSDANTQRKREQQANQHMHVPISSHLHACAGRLGVADNQAAPMPLANIAFQSQSPRLEEG